MRAVAAATTQKEEKNKTEKLLMITMQAKPWQYERHLEWQCLLSSHFSAQGRQYKPKPTGVQRRRRLHRQRIELLFMRTQHNT